MHAQTYHTASGYTVHVRRFDRYTVELETRNEAGETVATVSMDNASARDLLGQIGEAL